MIKRIAGLFLLLAVLFTMPAFGQSNSTSQQPQADAKMPITVYVSTGDEALTPAVKAVQDNLTKALGEGFTVNTVKPANDAPTQYVIIILATTVQGLDKDGKPVTNNVLSVSGTIHVKGHPFPFYLFSAPAVFDNSPEDAQQLSEDLLRVLGEVDAGVSEYGGPDKL
jgi:hypothetical protein